MYYYIEDKCYIAMNLILQVAMNKYNIAFVCMVIVGLVCISEAAVLIAQSDSANSERRNIIVTWLDSNDTSDAPVSISQEEFLDCLQFIS
jgi:hypothetical protein